MLVTLSGLPYLHSARHALIVKLVALMAHLLCTSVFWHDLNKMMVRLGIRAALWRRLTD